MVPRGVASLQTLVTMAAPDILCVSETNDDQTVLKVVFRHPVSVLLPLSVKSASEYCNLLNANRATMFGVLTAVRVWVSAQYPPGKKKQDKFPLGHLALCSCFMFLCVNM